METEQIWPPRVKVDLWVMAMKGYFSFLKTLRLCRVGSIFGTSCTKDVNLASLYVSHTSAVVRRPRLVFLHSFTDGLVSSLGQFLRGCSYPLHILPPQLTVLPIDTMQRNIEERYNCQWGWHSNVIRKAEHFETLKSGKRKTLEIVLVVVI